MQYYQVGVSMDLVFEELFADSYQIKYYCRRFENLKTAIASARAEVQLVSSHHIALFPP